MDETKQPGLRVDQVFLRAVLFQHREDALSLPPNTSVGEMAVTVTMQTGITEAGTAGFVGIRVDSDNTSNPLYRFSLDMVTLVSEEESSKNFPVEDFLRKNGPALLYPFVREALASITARGRFGPIYLKPFNMRVLAQEEVVVGQEKPPEESKPPQG